MTEIRKLITVVQSTRWEQGQEIDPPSHQVAAIAVIRNPYAGRYSHDLSLLEEAGAELGELLAVRGVDALGIAPADIHSYGKAAIVGTEGEKEHAAAVLHPRLGKPVRELIGPASAIIPSAKKIGGPGATIDCPLHYKDDAWKFSHFDAMEISVPGAPRADEIVVILALSDAGRPLHRVGEDLNVSDVMSAKE
ncbi:MAG: amino acid synthesis family protein [Pseudomonadota bacterium]|nr:amino acid synthesis family protein [Pseudomonadota bacterium]